MSLVKPPTMSDAKIAANQANSQKSTGPVTPEGVKRVRLGRLQHGLYVPDPQAGEERMKGKRDHATKPEGVPAAKPPRAQSNPSPANACQSSSATDAA